MLFAIATAAAQVSTQPTPPDAGPTRTPPTAADQRFIDDATKAFEEVVALRDAVEKFKVERAQGSVERAAARAVIQGLNELMALRDRIDLLHEKRIEILTQMVELQEQLIDKLEKRLLKPKSTFQKVLATLKTIGYILAGVSLGRAL